MSLKVSVLRLGLCAAMVLSWAAAGWAVNGAGSLIVAGAPHTPTHWDVQIGLPVTAEIHGVDPAEVGGSLPATLTVWVKSTFFGNTMLTQASLFESTATPTDVNPQNDAWDETTTVLQGIFFGDFESGNSDAWSSAVY